MATAKKNTEIYEEVRCYFDAELQHSDSPSVEM